MSAVNILTAISVLLTTLQKAAEFQQAIAKAQAEGRDLTDEEVDRFRTADDQARARLEAAIAAKRGA